MPRFTFPPPKPPDQTSESNRTLNSEGGSEPKSPAETNGPTSESPGVINYFGSSYTGADIKVVVHTYVTPDVNAEEQRVNDEIDLVRQIIDLANQIHGELTTGFDPVLRARSLRSMENLQAVNIVMQSLQTPPGLPETLKFSVQRKNLMELINSQNSYLKSLEDKLTSAKELREASSDTIVLGSLQTLSIQSHREKEAVRALGTSYVKGYTRGPRTIAGSMIFTVFNEHSFATLLRSIPRDMKQFGEMNDADVRTLLADQLPPLDFTIVFANEYGSLSTLSLYGVEFINGGMTLSVEDLLTEEVVQFVARDYDPMVDRGKIALDKANRGMHFKDGVRDQSATSLLIGNMDQYQAYLDRLGMRMRLSNR